MKTKLKILQKLLNLDLNLDIDNGVKYIEFKNKEDNEITIERLPIASISDLHMSIPEDSLDYVFVKVYYHMSKPNYYVIPKQPSYNFIKRIFTLYKLYNSFKIQKINVATDIRLNNKTHREMLLISTITHSTGGIQL